MSTLPDVTARVIFSTTDIIDVVEDQGATISEEEALDFMMDNYKYIEEAMVRAGFAAIDTLLSEARMGL